MHPLLQMLEGGDRRSIGRSNEAVARVLADPRLLDVLFAGMRSTDPLLRMRCADAAEKATAAHPEYLKLYKGVLLGELAHAEQKEVRWHVAPMLARLELSAAERNRVYATLLDYCNDRSSIVRTLAMQALADVAMPDARLRASARRHVRELTAAGTPAMTARGRRLLAQLARPAARAGAPRRRGA